MSNTSIYKWNEIKSNFHHNLLLGNGSSIAIHDGLSYPSLYQEACNSDLLSPELRQLFGYFHTDNFEVMLRLLLNARLINDSLDLKEKKTNEAYQEVKKALVSTIINVHPRHEDTEPYLPKMAEFMKDFGKIFSLNYDLLVYWAMLIGNNNYGLWFKDGFVDTNHSFDFKYNEYLFKNHHSAKGTTFVFYPHGSLFIASDFEGNELKICSDENSHLISSILDKWGENDTGDLLPLFVSEGKMSEKLKRIHRSLYLNLVYEELSELEDTLVIYGWSFDKQDDHIFQAIGNGILESIAISIHKDGKNWKNKRDDIVDKFKKHKKFKDCEIVFFDAESEGCWIH